MAYTEIPTDLFPSMTYGGGAITIPIAILIPHGLDAAKCDPATGDARSIAYALAARVEEWYAEIASADRPKALTASPRLSIGISTGDFPDSEVTELSIKAYRTRPEGYIEAEPV